MLGTRLQTGGRTARTWLLFFAVLFVAAVVSARTPERGPRADTSGDVAYATPMAVPAVAKVSMPQNVVPEDTVRRPDGPSSLALLAIGLACLYFVRSRQWVR